MRPGHHLPDSDQTVVDGATDTRTKSQRLHDAFAWGCGPRWPRASWAATAACRSPSSPPPRWPSWSRPPPRWPTRHCRCPGRAHRRQIHPADAGPDHHGRQRRHPLPGGVRQPLGPAALSGAQPPPGHPGSADRLLRTRSRLHPSPLRRTRLPLEGPPRPGRFRRRRPDRRRQTVLRLRPSHKAATDGTHHRNHRPGAGLDRRHRPTRNQPPPTTPKNYSPTTNTSPTTKSKNSEVISWWAWPEPATGRVYRRGSRAAWRLRWCGRPAPASGPSRSPATHRFPGRIR